MLIVFKKNAEFNVLSNCDLPCEVRALGHNKINSKTLSDLFIELESTESNSFKNRRNFTEQVDGKLAQSTESAESADGKQKLVHKKSLIETFQKLFKSGGKKKILLVSNSISSSNKSSHQSSFDPSWSTAIDSQLHSRTL